MTTPFRWDLSRRESLGRLISGQRAPAYREFHADLQTCIARVIAQAQVADLVFVGRSPESIFDHMSGLLADTQWAPRLSLLNLSLRSLTAEELRAMPNERAALRALLQDAGYAPSELIRRKRPLAFVDLVYVGRTYATLAEYLARSQPAHSAARHGTPDCAAPRVGSVHARHRTRKPAGAGTSPRAHGSHGRALAALADPGAERALAHNHPQRRACVCGLIA